MRGRESLIRLLQFTGTTTVETNLLVLPGLTRWSRRLVSFLPSCMNHRLPSHCFSDCLLLLHPSKTRRGAPYFPLRFSPASVPTRADLFDG